MKTKRHIILLMISSLAFQCLAQRVTANRSRVVSTHNNQARKQTLNSNARFTVKFLRMSLRFPTNWKTTKPNTTTVVTNVTVVTNKPTQQQQQQQPPTTQQQQPPPTTQQQQPPPTMQQQQQQINQPPLVVFRSP